jgi:hypothetical protein
MKVLSDSTRVDIAASMFTMQDLCESVRGAVQRGDIERALVQMKSIEQLLVGMRKQFQEAGFDLTLA